MKTLKFALIHTFTGVATERELLYSFLTIAPIIGAVIIPFYHHIIM